MRLVKVDSQGELSLTKNLRGDFPDYAILSHTWSTEEEDEFSFTDLKYGTGKSKVGYAKIEFCRKQVQEDGLQYFWMDTCSIDKTNQVELTEAIISMFRWYQHAAKCYVYLSDVSFSFNKDSWESDLRKSRWFTRGWTLQELIAPRSVDFFSREGKWLGNKITLERQLHTITGIPIMALRGVTVSKFSVDDRIRWAAKRNTTVLEDRAYCLQGILDIFMSPKYGEGRHAFVRLQDKISRRLGKSVDVDKLLSAQGPNSIYHVAFDRIPGFVGHTDKIDCLKTHLFDPTSRGILSILGPGGIGKSYLALELAHRLLTEHPEQLIFWVEATDQLSFERDILELGKRLAIPGIAEDKADVKTMVKQWLSNSVKDGWLLILDNADDEAIWGRRSSPTDQKSTLVDWLPVSVNSLVLITTRSRQVASHLAREVVELPMINRDKARSIFANTLEKPELTADKEAISVLLKILTCFPLAIIQAASYLNITQQPLETYVKLLQEPEKEIVKLLDKDFGDQSQYSAAHKAVALTWLVSFNQICQDPPFATQLLSSMAYVHENNIPVSLPHEISSKKDTLNAFTPPKEHSFVTRQTGEKDRTSDMMLCDMLRQVKDNDAQLDRKRKTGRTALKKTGDGRGTLSRHDGLDKEPCTRAEATQGQHFTAMHDFTKDKVDDRFYARPPNKWKSYWKVGRVFALIIHIVDTGTHRCKLSNEFRGLKEIMCIQRMIVVRSCKGFCFAVPVNSYDGRRTVIPGSSEINRQARAIIYMDGTEPTLLPEERELSKAPIKVNPVNDQTLAKACCIDFAKIQTVEYSVSTMAIGMVSEDSMANLVRYSKEYMCS